MPDSRPPFDQGYESFSLAFPDKAAKVTYRPFYLCPLCLIAFPEAALLSCWLTQDHMSGTVLMHGVPTRAHPAESERLKADMNRAALPDGWKVLQLDIELSGHGELKSEVCIAPD